MARSQQKEQNDKEGLARMYSKLNGGIKQIKDQQSGVGAGPRDVCTANCELLNE